MLAALIFLPLLSVLSHSHPVTHSCSETTPLSTCLFSLMKLPSQLSVLVRLINEKTKVILRREREFLEDNLKISFFFLIIYFFNGAALFFSVGCLAKP